MEKVLIVEDEKGVADIITKFLEREKFSVDVALDFEEAQEKITQEYAVVLLDINLGGKDSFPLLESLRKDHPDTIVIMVTGYDSDENLEKAKKLGADGFIPKPIIPEFLKKFITEEIRKIKERRAHQ